ncbi:hypothetical protein ACF1AE_19445 [Streptomyces sp. NPDC014986]|uniref:hypothetical protein n=2 Tax=Streptomyces TaxID=1883 RepID=UPI0036FA1219
MMNMTLSLTPSGMTRMKLGHLAAEHGPHHPEVVRLSFELAEQLRQEGEFDEAEEVLRWVVVERRGRRSR